MINFKIVPYHFNISIIKTIIKDKSKPLNDISNLRPVAVSDTLSNLYENIVLEKLKADYTSD